MPRARHRVGRGSAAGPPTVVGSCPARLSSAATGTSWTLSKLAPPPHSPGRTSIAHTVARVSESPRSHIAEVVAALSDTQVGLLLRMAEAMRVPVQVEQSTESDIVSDYFSEALANFLLLHHAIHIEPLNKAAFEYLFVACSEASGRRATRNPASGSASYDVEADGVRWSLKTEAGKKLSVATVRIEKFMEARWIRECTNPAKCAAAVREHIPAHMQDYERLAILRARQDATATVTSYELFELPKAELLRLTNAQDDWFTKEGKKESYGADVLDGDGERVFRVLLDSSVEKVRIWFSTAKAINHGRWVVQRPDVVA